MEPSILKSVKKVLGLDSTDTSFDLDIIMHINTVLAVLNQLGVGPNDGFVIEDDTATWDTFLGPDLRFHAVKSYVWLRVRMLFDPPQTSFAIKAMEDQARELEFRLNFQREESPVLANNYLVLDGGEA